MQIDDAPMVTALIESGQANTPANTWPVFKHTVGLDRSSFLTSSMADRCIRELWYNKRDKSQTFGTWGFAERGHAVETWVVEKLRLATLPSNITLSCLGDDQVSFVDAERRLAGTPDGIMFIHDRKADVTYIVVIEIKSIDPRTNKDVALPKQAHVTQCYQNIHLVALNFPHCIVLGTTLVYVDASNFQEVHEYSIENDESLSEKIDTLAQKAALVFSTTSVSDLPLEGVYRNECKNCNYKTQCSADAIATKTAKTELPSGATRNDIRKAASRLFGQPQSRT